MMAGAGRMASAMARHGVIMAGRKGIQAAGQAVAGRREFFGQAAEMAGDYRAGLQGLAILQEKDFADDALVRQQLAFTQKSYLNPEASAEFRVEYGGAIAPGLGKGNITRPVADRLEMEAARFTARYDIDAQTGGRMAGLLAKYAKVPDVKTGVGMMAESAEYLNVYGLGTPRSMMPSLTGLEASMVEEGGGGRFRDLGSLSAWFGAATFDTQEPGDGRRPDHPGRQADAAVLGEGGAGPREVRDHARDGLRHGDPQAGRGPGDEGRAGGNLMLAEGRVRPSPRSGARRDQGHPA